MLPGLWVALEYVIGQSLTQNGRRMTYCGMRSVKRHSVSSGYSSVYPGLGAVSS